VVDACCGTGDLAAAFARAGARVVGVDFTPEMLRGARGKLDGGVLACGDCLRLPLRSGAADLCSVAFGVRNLADADRGLAELARVLRPGGRLFVLEFSTPRGALLGRVYRLYFTRLLPWIGRRISEDANAYSYLPRTVLAWPAPEEFCARMERAGLVDCGFELLTRGIACLHWGRVPESGAERGEHG
jgi:demethylmenaquinone methyltransferase/2-methoxy-6-polyprenyl-1,4-benzoquinol methylase